MNILLLIPIRYNLIKSPIPTFFPTLYFVQELFLGQNITSSRGLQWHLPSPFSTWYFFPNKSSISASSFISLTCPDSKKSHYKSKLGISHLSWVHKTPGFSVQFSMNWLKSSPLAIRVVAVSCCIRIILTQTCYLLARLFNETVSYIILCQPNHIQFMNPCYENKPFSSFITHFYSCCSVIATFIYTIFFCLNILSASAKNIFLLTLDCWTSPSSFTVSHL